MILILLAGGIFVYTTDFYHADPVALETLNSADGVAITPTAYTPLLRQLAAEGMDACLVRMPLHLALLGIQKADTVMAEHRVLAPTDAVVTCIAGGNHSQFGSYGIQKGDGIAQITPEEQIRKTVESIRKEIID